MGVFQGRRARPRMAGLRKHNWRAVSDHLLPAGDAGVGQSQLGRPSSVESTPSNERPEFWSRNERLWLCHRGHEQPGDRGGSMHESGESSVVLRGKRDPLRWQRLLQ